MQLDQLERQKAQNFKDLKFQKTESKTNRDKERRDS